MGLLDLFHHGKGMTNRLGGDRTGHQQSDVQGLGNLAKVRARVEDLLDPVLDSVEAILRNGDGQRGEELLLSR